MTDTTTRTLSRTPHMRPNALPTSRAVNHVSALVGRVDAAEPIRRRAVQDALTGALAGQRERRAQTFEWAAYRPGVDYPGRSSVAELMAQRARCLATAAAFRAHAQLLQSGSFDEPWTGFAADIDSVMTEMTHNFTEDAR